MYVVLINPPHPYLIKPDSQAPLGLMYLASMIRNAGHTVEICNLSSKPVSHAVDYIPHGADLYGFTATCIDYQSCEFMAQQMRFIMEDPVIVIGGPHPTVYPDGVDSRLFDARCRGDGEWAILHMLEDVECKSLQQEYVGSVYQDISNLPWPARDLMDVIGGDVFAEGEHYFGGKSTVIISARGCPHSCVFCASNYLTGGNLRPRPMDDVVAEMKHVIEKHGVREFRFSDDTLNFNKKRVREFCEAVGPLDVAWRCSVHAKICGPDDFKRMADAGCKEISPGIESGDQRVLDALNKRVSVKNNRNLINWATEAGINVRVLLMSGTPGEHADTPEINRDFLKTVNYRLVSLTQFRPIPGSPIWHWPEKSGTRILDRDVAKYNFYFWRKGPDGDMEPTPIVSVIETDTLSRLQLENNMERMRQYVLETGKANRG